MLVLIHESLNSEGELGSFKKIQQWSMYIYIHLLVELWTNLSHIWHSHTMWHSYYTHFHVDVCSAYSFSNTWELCPNLSVFGNDHNFDTTLLLSLSRSLTPKKLSSTILELKGGRCHSIYVDMSRNIITTHYNTESK